MALRRVKPDQKMLERTKNCINQSPRKEKSQLLEEACLSGVGDSIFEDTSNSTWGFGKK